MTDPRLPERDTTQVDALVADRYLDALLAAADRHAVDVPADASLDPDVREAARVLRTALVRVHPSFRFEDRLASRLADLAAAQAGRSRVAAGGGTVLPFPAMARTDPALDAILRGDLDPSAAEAELDEDDDRATDRRPLIVTGAITSAALSLAGVAWVAWRASRPATRRSAMGRAARTAHARRAASGTSLVGPA